MGGVVLGAIIGNEIEKSARRDQPGVRITVTLNGTKIHVSQVPGADWLARVTLWYPSGLQAGLRRRWTRLPRPHVNDTMQRWSTPSDQNT